jgi:hypothetical protein
MKGGIGGLESGCMQLYVATVDWLITHKVGALIRVCIMNKYALPVRATLQC